MADTYKIEVHKREEMGSRNVRNLRKEGNFKIRFLPEELPDGGG